MEEHDLGAVHREGRYHDGAPSSCRGGDDVGEPVERGAFVMDTVAVGRLDHQRIDRSDGRRRQQQRVARSTEITAECDRDITVPDVQLDNRRAEDMASRTEDRTHLGRHLAPLRRLHLHEKVGGGTGIGLRVQGQRGAMLGEALAVRESGVFLLQVPTVR